MALVVYPGGPSRNRRWHHHLVLSDGLAFAGALVAAGRPTTMLSESAAAATFGLINSIGQLGGFAGRYVVGFLNTQTHSLTAGFGFIALAYVTAGSLILSLRNQPS